MNSPISMFVLFQISSRYSCSFAFSYVIPIGMIQAITNQQVGFNVITELIIGYALLGRPVTMMMFKPVNNPYQLYFNPYFHTMFSALNLASHFKLGHYMKIPPRPMFWSQVIATVVTSAIQLGVQAGCFCQSDQRGM
ncbi:OPT oligopeptide transporter protein-domain-containing protein, partial [Mycena olivaceomarginata]